MSVYRPKGSPYYHFDFVVKGQRYYGSTSCNSKRDAERYERDRRTEAALGVKDKPTLTVDEATGLYWEHKGQFDSAAGTTEYQLANLGRIIGATRLFHDVDDLAVADFIARRRGEFARGSKRLISNSSVNREVELLKRVVNHVKGTYKAPEIIWSRHKLKEPAERRRYASADEETRLFDKLRAKDHDLADLVEFALLCGARKNAIVTLLWSKVDLRSQTASVHTKGDVWHTFPLSARMIEIIANRPKVAPQVFTYVCKQTRAALTDKTGRKHPGRRKGERYPFSKDGWSRQWKTILKDAGIEDFRFHDLRHTAGTRITNASNLKVAQQLLGHTRIETTARYAHVEDADIRRALENVEQSRNSPELRPGAEEENRRNTRGAA